MAQHADPLIKFVDCSGAFDTNGQNLPDQVHLLAAAHEALAEHIEAELKAGGIWSRI